MTVAVSRNLISPEVAQRLTDIAIEHAGEHAPDFLIGAGVGLLLRQGASVAEVEAAIDKSVSTMKAALPFFVTLRECLHAPEDDVACEASSKEPPR